MLRPTLALAAVALLAVSSSAAAACTVSAPRSSRHDAEDLRTVRIVSGPGSLAVRATADADGVEMEGEACASDSALLEDVRIDVERRGDVLVVTAFTPRTGFLQDARLDLNVHLPEGLAVEIEDGSGDVDVAEVASLTLRDGSGDVAVRAVTGNVRVDDDGSGDFTASDVGGDVTVVDDGSGSIVLRRIGGSVVVLDDGSGDITVEGVAGDLTIEDAGSGAVRFSEVQGDVSVPRE